MKPKTSMRLRTYAGLQLVANSRLLEGTAGQVAEEIAREAEENPALEVLGSLNRWQPDGSCPAPRREWGTGQGRYEASLEAMGERIAERPSEMRELEEQLRLLLDRADLPWALRLLHSLDDSGFLPSDLPELADRLNIPQDATERLACALRELEPPGIGARNVRECFLMQCEALAANMPDSQRGPCAAARRLIELAWDALVHQQPKQAARITGLPVETVREAIHFMAENLQPNPRSMLGAPDEETTVLGSADLVVVRGKSLCGPALLLEIPGEDACSLRVSVVFEHALKPSAAGDLSPAERIWTRDRVDRARVFAAALRQRWVLLRRVGEYLLERQAAFFEQGPASLLPLTRLEVAAALGLHESTVSRAVQGKVLQLPNGRRVPMSDLFDHSLPVKAVIRELLNQAGQPVSDREIAAWLKLRGWQIARRTVAKYREQMNIPTVHQRGRATWVV